MAEEAAENANPDNSKYDKTLKKLHDESDAEIQAEKEALDDKLDKQDINLRGYIEEYEKVLDSAKFKDTELYKEFEKDLAKQKSGLADDELQTEIEELDHKLKTHKINEDQYYIELGEYLKANANRDSELWNEYNDKLAERGGGDSETISKESSDKAKSESESAFDAEKADLEKRKKLHTDGLDDEKKYYDELGNILENYKGKLDDYAPYQEAYDKKAEYEKKVKEEEKKLAEDSAKAEFDALKKSLDDEIITREDFNKRYGELKKEWSENNIGISKYTADKISEINKRQTDDFKKDIENAVGDAEDIYKELLQTREKAADSMTSGSLFKNVDTVDGKRPIFEDLSKRTEEIKQYAKDYAKLSQMNGVPPDLLQEIKNMDFDDRRAVVAELVKMTDNNRQAYFNEYNSWQAAARYAAEVETAGETAAAEEYAQNRFNEVFADPDNAYVIGRSMGAEWMKGFAEMLDGQNAANVMSRLAPNVFGNFESFVQKNSENTVSVKTPIMINIGTKSIEFTIEDYLKGKGLIGREHNIL